ncbi:hypothetical protein X975_21746, partial [Stegodyphus mimosarum]
MGCLRFQNKSTVDLPSLLHHHGILPLGQFTAGPIQKTIFLACLNYIHSVYNAKVKECVKYQPT